MNSDEAGVRVPLWRGRVGGLAVAGRRRTAPVMLSKLQNMKQEIETTDDGNIAHIP